MNIEREKNNRNELSFTEKTRIINVIIYGLGMIFAYTTEYFFVILLLLYIHLFVISLFLILELRYVILTKKNFFKHILTNWLVFLGFAILTFDLLKIFLKIDVLKIVLGKV
ncbi:hypothetical protein [Flavobacterium sp.]|uniref:hypothetical protein n=1 Tax=Flavobacterium sp. TaxID=239 RepID=UPI00286DC9F6|nr:hypothetical protein [Flavobacterium sp.]